MTVDNHQCNYPCCYDLHDNEAERTEQTEWTEQRNRCGEMEAGSRIEAVDESQEDADKETVQDDEESKCQIIETHNRSGRKQKYRELTLKQVSRRHFTLL